MVDASLRDSIHKFIEEPPLEWDDRPAYPRLKIRPRDNEFFRYYVQTLGKTEELIQVGDKDTYTEAQRALRDNAKKLRKSLIDWSQEDLTALFKMMAKRTVLVVITTPNFDSAYRIFSVLNSRGLSLTPADIFKSQVIGAVPDKDKESFTNMWEEQEEELGSDKFNDLFKHIRTIKTQTQHTQGRILKEFPEKVLNSYTEAGNGKGFITEVLKPYARAYKRLIDQDLPWESVKFWIKHLNRISSEDRIINEWQPAALWALKEHGDDEEFLNEFFKKLERLAAIMMICRNHHERPGRYIKLLRQLINGEGLDAGAFEIRDYEKQRVADWLNGEIYSPRSNKICKYVLLRLDSIFAKESGVSYNPKIISIEHVLPQNPKPNSDWMQNFTEEQREYWTHRLGNLLLLNWRTNSSAGNQDFEIKKEKFFKRKISDSITFALTTQVIQEPEWTPATVEARHKMLLDVLRQEWGF